MGNSLVDSEGLRRFKDNVYSHVVSKEMIDDMIGNTASVPVDNGTLREDMARVKLSLGPYTDRAAITLKAKETGVVISSSGTKVAKSGWAIAEFTAILGNEYLFKPGATDGAVCVFAEYIDKVETRGVDYSYTYDAKGRPATAAATYNGKSYSYSFAYTESEDGGSEIVTITDNVAMKVVGYLPPTYQTTVGAYQPLTILNASAELPKDGYCRFVSNFQARASIKVIVSYKVDSADLTMKVVRDGMTASMCTQLSRVNQKVDEAKAATEELRGGVAVSGAAFAGFARPNGDPSPDAQTVYGDKALVRKIGKHLRMAVVKNGKAVYLAPGRITADEEGKTVAIDGTQGDVLCATDMDLYLMRATDAVDGVEQNVEGVGMGACSWYGNAAKRVPMFGMVPGYTVNTQLSGDTRAQAHSIYNKAVKGSFSTPDALFKTTMFDGSGLPNTGVSGLDSIKQAQNKNADALTARPYMGLHPDMYSIWIALMYAELGTLNSTSLTCMGTGCTAQESVDASTFYDTKISANSGLKIIPASGTATYASLMAKSLKATSSAEASYNMDGLNKSSYAMTEMLEPLRVMDAVVRDKKTSVIGSPVSFVYFDSSTGKLNVVGKSATFDVTTGAGMTAGTRYYQVRDIPGCEGLKDGVLSAVVNCYVRMDCKDGVVTQAGVSMTGGKVIYKFSHAVYRGLQMPMDGAFKHLSYAYHVKYGHGTNTAMDYVFATTHNIEDVKPLKSFATADYSGDVNATLNVLEGLNLRTDKKKCESGWLKTADYSVSMLFGSTVNGGSHAYENAYKWNTTCWGGIADSNGYLAEGKKQVCASVCGCSASNGNASARSLNCIGGLGSGSSDYSGAFAVLLGA